MDTNSKLFAPISNPEFYIPETYAFVMHEDDLCRVTRLFSNGGDPHCQLQLYKRKNDGTIIPTSEFLKGIPVAELSSALDASDEDVSEAAKAQIRYWGIWEHMHPMNIRSDGDVRRMLNWALNKHNKIC